MITIDLDEVEACCEPAGLEHATYWQQCEAASQRALTLALHENRVRDECLKTAVDALKLYSASTDSTARHALNYIRQRLAELEPEEKTE